jgi:ATP-dependent phosphofructokinase / diphosphate-dependent phosphofructokinase
MLKVAILTGGGDCPGLNAVIRAVVRRAATHSFEVMGVRDGWKGLLEPMGRTQRLTPESVSGILHVGGTILGTSRTNPFKRPEGAKALLDNIETLGIGAIIAVGGEDTLGVAQKLFELGTKVVGVPKTIDNDLSGTDFTFGFDTAVSIATEAIDRIHTTAESHHRVMVVEVMGRHAGWIATYSGLAGGADVTLIPEVPVDLTQVCDHIQHRHLLGKSFSIVVVAEGAKLKDGQLPMRAARPGDEFEHERLGGIGQVIAEEIEKRTAFETRVTVLGHVQRGGSPTAHDRVLATRFGVFACDLVAREDFGKMAALQGPRIVAVPIADAVSRLKTVDPDLYELAKGFFG